MIINHYHGVRASWESLPLSSALQYGLKLINNATRDRFYLVQFVSPNVVSFFILYGLSFFLVDAPLSSDKVKLLAMSYV